MEEKETEEQEACEYIQSICAYTVSSDQHTSAYIKSCSKEASSRAKEKEEQEACEYTVYMCVYSLYVRIESLCVYMCISD